MIAFRDDTFHHAPLCIEAVGGKIYFLEDIDATYPSARMGPLFGLNSTAGAFSHRVEQYLQLLTTSDIYVFPTAVVLL